MESRLRYREITKRFSVQDTRARLQQLSVYIVQKRKALLESQAPLRIFGHPNNTSESYLTSDLINRYEGIFDSAEAIVIDSTEFEPAEARFVKVISHTIGNTLK